MSRLITLLLGFLLIAENISIITEADPDTTIVDVECNPNTWETNDPYGPLVARTCDDLVNDTPGERNYSKYVNESYNGTTVYAYASCNQQLTQGDCFTCLDEAINELFDMCTYAIGAQITMVDCRMRYENYPFYG